MIKIDTDYTTLELKAENHALLTDVLELARKTPLGTAIVFGENAVFLLPQPHHKYGLSDLNIVPKIYLNRRDAPHLAEFDLVLNDDSNDESFAEMFSQFDEHELVTIDQWDDWFYEMTHAIDEDMADGVTKFMLVHGHQDAISIQDYEGYFDRNTTSAT